MGGGGGGGGVCYLIRSPGGGGGGGWEANKTKGYENFGGLNGDCGL